MNSGRRARRGPGNGIRRASVWLAAVVMAGSACSLLNRAGPDVTCADLGDGDTNACAEGIIATCVAGQMQYQVCDDSKVCEASWQQPGHHQCTQPGGGGTGTGGSGTGNTGNTATGGSGGGPCTVSDVCVVASNTAGGIISIAVDAQSVYFAGSHGDVWKASKLGGFPQSLVPATTLDNLGHLSIDQNHVYFDAYGLNRVPLSGGVAEQVASGYTPYWSVTDTTYVWSGLPPRLHRFRKADGVDEILADGNYTCLSCLPLRLDDEAVYWAPFPNVIARLPKTASPADVPSTINVGSVVVADFVVGDSYIFAVDRSNGKVWRISKTDGTTSGLASLTATAPRVALAGSTVYWVDGTHLWSIPDTGGTSTLLATRVSGTISPVPIAVDDQFVFWVEKGFQVVRAPK